MLSSGWKNKNNKALWFGLGTYWEINLRNLNSRLGGTCEPAKEAQPFLLIEPWHQTMASENNSGAPSEAGASEENAGLVRLSPHSCSGSLGPPLEPPSAQANCRRNSLQNLADHLLATRGQCRKVYPDGTGSRKTRRGYQAR